MTEFYATIGPLSFLRVGRVWSIDLGRFGIYGIGWRHVRARRI